MLCEYAQRIWFIFDFWARDITPHRKNHKETVEEMKKSSFLKIIINFNFISTAPVALVASVAVGAVAAGLTGGGTILGVAMLVGASDKNCY